jgi:hypothetical protein
VGDWQRPVQVGDLDEVGRDEASSWHLLEGFEDARVMYALGDDCLDEILLSPHTIIMHRPGDLRKIATQL